MNTEFMNTSRNVEQPEAGPVTPIQKSTHLKSIQSGRMFVFTDILAQRSDMMPCDAKGNMVGNITDAEGNGPSVDREKTAYLGQVQVDEKTGKTHYRLHRYTDILAQRLEMISIDSPEAWDEYVSGHKQVRAIKAAPVEPSDPATVILTRQAGGGKVVPTGENQLELPEVSGLKSRDAKNKLAQFMMEVLGVKVSQQPKIEEVLAECQTLLEAFNAKQAA